MTDGDDQPDDLLRERAQGSRWKLWFLLEADRTLVVGVILLAFFLTIQVAAMLYPGSETTLRTTSSVTYLFQGFVMATITGVTLVVTLNQLVLSQELGAVGDQRERMDGAMEFREDAADLLGAPVSPARPSQFLRAFVDVAGERASTLQATVPRDSDLAASVDDLVYSVTGNAESVAAELDGATFGEFDVLSAALDFNYSWKVFAARRIRSEFGDELDDESATVLDELIEILELYGPAREHFKTLYFRWELIDLSGAILWSALPALVVSLFMVAFFDPRTFAADVFGLQGLLLAVTGASTVAIVPFVVLLAYVLRIATATKHTLSIGPFILRETDQVEEVEWNE